ncbi:MAG: hypothetical protein J2P25_06690 [Nocardiopsaceae bacterium]|nr:hypothetical protein [Nocardiopsaceae bacterium]
MREENDWTDGDAGLVPRPRTEAAGNAGERETPGFDLADIVDDPAREALIQVRATSPRGQVTDPRLLERVREGIRSLLSRGPPHPDTPNPHHP